MKLSCAVVRAACTLAAALAAAEQVSSAEAGSAAERATSVNNLSISFNLSDFFIVCHVLVSNLESYCKVHHNVSRLKSIDVYSLFLLASHC